MLYQGQANVHYAYEILLALSGWIYAYRMLPWDQFMSYTRIGRIVYFVSRIVMMTLYDILTLLLEMLTSVIRNLTECAEIT